MIEEVGSPAEGDAIDLLGVVLALDEERPQPPSGFRWRTGFNWARVNRELLERLLTASAIADGDHSGLAELDDRALVAIAEGAFGPTFRPRAMDRIGPVLRELWIPQASPAALERLSVLTQSALGRAYAGLRLRTPEQRISFLTGRKLSKNFRTNLRSTFMQEHRGAWLVDEASTRSLKIDGAYRELIGTGEEPPYPPYEHAEEAWRMIEELERSGEPVRGLIVLPTGAGKTDVAVDWLLRRLEADSDLRVLWVAHQISLLEQAAVRIAAKAEERATGFRRTLRIFCSGGEPLAAMHPQETDIALATIQTLARDLGKGGKKTKQVATFFEHPTLVVVDEAHHAAANGYQLLLDLGRSKQLRDLVGLTATPWPATEAAQRTLQATFPMRIVERSREELMANHVLATYDYTAVPTPGTIDLTDQEKADTKARGDFSPSALRKLETEERNALVVSTYMQQRDLWGRTLLFTTTIENADLLCGMLVDAGADARVLHSASAQGLRDLRPWFKQTERAVIVSVGMLLEGVDLPEARTALIARPTTSPIVLSQMMGRVLRGTAAGGEGQAHVVYLVDDFADFGGLATPVPPSPEPGRGVDVVKIAPRVAEFPIDLAGQIAAMLAAQQQQTMEEEPEENLELEQPEALPFVSLESRRLLGYYEALDGLKIPVLDNQIDALEDFMDEVAAGRGDSRTSFRMSPRPSPGHLEALAEAVKLGQAPLELHRIEREISPRTLAHALEDDTPRTAGEVQALIESAYGEPLIKAAYASLRHFEEAVERARHRVRSGRSGGPESAELPDPEANNPALPRGRRDLEAIVAHVLEFAEAHLPATRKGRLMVPTVRWTEKVERGKFGEWQMGDEVGEHLISVNRLLKTSSEHIPDEWIGFIVWHELMHAVTPGQTHDAEFYALETLWPDALACDAAIQAIPKKWSMKPADYPSPRRRVREEVLKEWTTTGRLPATGDVDDPDLRAALEAEVERRIDALY